MITRLHGEINKILADPATRQKLVDAGANVMPLSIGKLRRVV